MQDIDSVVALRIDTVIYNNVGQHGLAWEDVWSAGSQTINIQEIVYCLWFGVG